MASEIFEIEITDRHIYWAEAKEGEVKMHRSQRFGEATDEVLLCWSPDTIRRFLLWAEDEKSVTFSCTGPLAYQIRKLSKELNLTPEMFVWHAVKLFIDADTV